MKNKNHPRNQFAQAVGLCYYFPISYALESRSSYQSLAGLLSCGAYFLSITFNL